MLYSLLGVHRYGRFIFIVRVFISSGLQVVKVAWMVMQSGRRGGRLLCLQWEASNGGNEAPLI
jgi:hypothetical protein